MLAKADCQSKHHCLTQRIREQARSHRSCGVFYNSVGAFVIAGFSANMHAAIIADFAGAMDPVVVTDFARPVDAMVIPRFGMRAVAAGGGAVA